nr:uncharacterized protein LOC123284642 isoform X6 [Equus asinus]
MRVFLYFHQAPADIFESAERNYWDQRCPDTTASLEAMETWSWQWLSSLRRMPRPLSRRRQLTTKPCFLAVIDTSVWEAKQMRERNSICPPERDVLQLSNQRMDQKIRGIWGHRGSLRIHGLHLENCYCGGKPTGFNRRLKFEVSPPFFILMMIYFISHNVSYLSLVSDRVKNILPCVLLLCCLSYN